jgi:hypothetical protein
MTTVTYPIDHSIVCHRHVALPLFSMFVAVVTLIYVLDCFHQAIGQHTAVCSIPRDVVPTRQGHEGTQRCDVGFKAYRKDRLWRLHRGGFNPHLCFLIVESYAARFVRTSRDEQIGP